MTEHTGSADMREVVVTNLRAAVPGLAAVYLFGSQASGEAGPASDVDIAVLVEHGAAGLPTIYLAEGLAERLGRDVDVIDLAAASTVLRSQVIAGGERLYARDLAAAERFEDFVYSDYARLNEERAGILLDIRERGSVRCG